MSMRDLLYPEREGPEPRPADGARGADDPVVRARAAQKVERPKRFWKEVSLAPTAGGLVLQLDGRPARTPGRNPLAFTDPAAARAVAAEWRAVGAEIDPGAMVLTRIANAAIDRVALAIEEVRADVLAYCASDLVCYRAAEPARLVALQNAQWTPVIDHARAAYGARFVLAEGVMFVAQAESALEAIAERLRRVVDPLPLAALHVMTSITGSALIALAVFEGALRPEAGFAAGELDADFQASLWGRDGEAEAARARRAREFFGAALLCGRTGDQ